MRCKMMTASTPATVETNFAKKYALQTPGHGVPPDYAIHGGGFPIRVNGVEGVIGTIVVSGLRQEHDHQVIAEVVRDFVSRKQA